MRKPYWTRAARRSKAWRALSTGLSVVFRWVFLTLSDRWALENLKDVWLRVTGLLQDAIDRQSDPTNALVRAAHSELRKNNLAGAQLAFESAINLSPANADLHLTRSACLTYLEGNPVKLFAELEIGVAKARAAARAQGLGDLKLRVLGDDFGGLHATVLDGLLKLKKLDLIENDHIMVVRRSAVGNHAYLDCWRRHLPIMVTNDNSYAAMKSLLSPIFEEISVLECRSGFVPLYDAFNTALNAWGDAPPLLELTPEQREAGDRVLQSIGIPAGNWFAGLHVREGAKGGRARSGPDADISTYRQAVRKITERGGWVIRMGIGGTPMDPMPRVWDYANSEHQSDWMDVYLWGACRFFVGTSSGPVWVPPTFGTPVILTNATTLGLTLNFARSLIMPKLLWSKSRQRFLTYREMFDGPYAWSVRPEYDDGDVTLVSNTPDELEAAVTEMLDKVESPDRHRERTPNQVTLDRIRAPYAKTSQARVANSFLELHSDLIA